MERYNTRFSVTESDLEGNTFKGLASAFGSVVDCWCPTIIHPGAFMKTLAERGNRVKVLWQHNPDWPIGKPILLQETEVGLSVSAKISKTTMGNDCMTLIRDEVVDELSIGFDPIKFDFEQVEGQEVRHIRELRLWEVSPVTFAADQMAKITEANRAMRGGPDSLTYESVLTWITEQHEGRVLSKKNKTIVQAAIDALQALLTAAEPPASDDEAQALTRRVEALLRDLELDGMARGILAAAR